MQRHIAGLVTLTIGCLAGHAAATEVASPSPSIVVQGKAQKEKAQKPKASRFAVVRIGTAMSVSPAKDVPKLKKRVAQEYKDALKAWNSAKKQAAKGKQKFDEPKPRKKPFKVLSSSFPSEDKAQEYIKKLKERADKKKGRTRRASGRKKTGKKKGK